MNDKTIKAEICFGTEFDGAGKRIDALQLLAATQKIESMALDVFGGYTWLSSEGGWLNESRVPVVEPGRILVIQCASCKTFEVRALAAFIRDQLNQSCVCLTISPVDMTFV
jgi:hypothetical protein